MKIKKNDNVIIIAGKDKGKTAKVLRVFPNLDKVLVEGINKLKKSQRATKSGQKGQIYIVAGHSDYSSFDGVYDPYAGNSRE